MKLYVRYKKNGKWTWRPATAADILDRYKLEQAGAELHSEATKKLVDGNDDDKAEVS